MPIRLGIVSLLFISAIYATDPYCGAYTPAMKLEWLARQARDLEFRSYAAQPHVARKGSRALAVSNFIDTYVGAKMASDGVIPAPPSGDAEFLRRIMLDLTGRIPTPEVLDAFLANDNPNKRNDLIESLLASEAYVDRWSLYYRDLFQVTSRYYQFIPPEGRNKFNDYLRDFIQKDRPYNQVAREIIAAEGTGHEYGPVNYISRGYQNGDPIQDTFDTITDRTTVRFLGFKSECISCHDGRRHLEEINLFLTRQRRTDFWRMSAFFSRLDLRILQLDSFSRQFSFLAKDRNSGGYSAIVRADNPGPRPLRYGGPYEPKFILTGETAKSGDWRKEFGRLATEHRQFARATVNYLWAAMFSQGIVDPPDNWDLDRLDPANPPRAPFTIQPSHPELLERLADEFIRSNYSIKTMLRLMAQSQSYQISSRYDGTWKPEYERYFARRIVRRLGPEELFDAISTATLTETPMYNLLDDSPVYYAAKLLDPTEPRDNFSVRNFLSQFGRGDYWDIPAVRSSNVLQSLYLMNDNTLNFRTFPNRDGGRPNRVTQILSSRMSDDEAIQLLFKSTLTRPASADEINIVKAQRKGTKDQWLADLQWALLNKLDFLFNF